MYLKRLDVQGFKSFANKTTLEFGSGVTCVVGPNGCGKTNVADSLRWVLGEHASRTLRARKTEDVIFAGSDRRAPMGVAEVSIALDNAGQWLPVDFNEVVVTRRAYRNGENEYFINHARVRLRDVVDLFMRAQVGQNSYAFMGQGMVEQVLSLRPEDRRALIEEAADVRLHRTRLEEAQSRLKATRENLDRVHMLVREIEPRITQLERQAGRAVKYQELTRELAAALHVWYAHQWQDVNDALLAAMSAFDQQTEEFERIRTAVQADEAALTQLRAAIDERKREIAVREERLRTLEDYARDLERRAALDAERETHLRDRIAELTAELATLREDETAHATATRVIDTSEQEAALAQARDALSEARASLSAVEEQLLSVHREALAQEQAAAAERMAADALGRRIAETEDRLARLRREATAGADERQKLIGQLAAWARDYRRALTDARAVTPRIEEAIAERSAVATRIERGRAEHAGLDDEVRALRAQVEALEMKFEMIETLDAPPQSPDAGIRMILEAGGVLKRETVPEDIELRGVLGLVGQIVKVPPGLERAIEAALADSLYAIVLQRASDVRPVLDFLLTGEAGRATLYALEELQEVRPLHLMKERGVLGVASQLVRCEGRYRKLIDTLLGRTIVVEDLALAQRVVRRGMAQAVATLEGVLLRPVGSIAAGTVSSVQASFKREREADDIPERLAELRPRLADREEALAIAAAALSDDTKRHDELARAIEALREQKARADGDLASVRGGIASFAARLGAIHSASRRRVSDLDRLAPAVAQAQQERDAALEAASAAERAQQGARQRSVALESQRASLTDRVAELAATVAHLDGELRTERQAGESDRIARERLARQIAAKQEQQGKIAEEAHAIAARHGATSRELGEKSAEVAALRVELEPAREELAQLESRERSLTAELADANAGMRTAERGLFDAENDVRIRRDELDTLRQNLEAEGFVATPDGEIERAPEPEPGPQPDVTGAYDDADAIPAQPGDLPGWLRSDDQPGLPPIRGGAAVNPAEVRDRIAELRGQIRALGPVNEQAAADYSESRERYDFLKEQLNDLQQAEEQLNEAIRELEGIIRERFRTTFKLVNTEFERYFSAFFRGGTARLELGETDEDGLPGIEIVAQPPGKKLGSLALLSGGERSLTAVALLFALLQANPSPICVLDEVDAALDEANVGRFVEELRELSKRTQFIIITHNRRTIETADTIYGVSMGADSVSRILSLRLADVKTPED